jgi:hypothetical protein
VNPQLVFARRQPAHLDQQAGAGLAVREHHLARRAKRPGRVDQVHRSAELLGLGRPGGAEQRQSGRTMSQPTHAVTGIYVDEKQDHPCLIRIYGRLVDPRFRTGDRKLGEHELESCKELFPGGFQNPVRVQLEGRQNRFLRGVRVCLGGKPLIYAPPLDVGIPKEHKVKGLQVWSAVVSGCSLVGRLELGRIRQGGSRSGAKLDPASVGHEVANDAGHVHPVARDGGWQAIIGRNAGLDRFG